MSPPLPISFGVLLPLASAMLLAGCTGFEPEKSVDRYQSAVFCVHTIIAETSFNSEQKSRLQATADRLLQEPISQNDAVQIALTNSPAFQAMLAQYWATERMPHSKGELLTRSSVSSAAVLPMSLRSRARSVLACLTY
jgi:hypothetical protein